MKYIVAVKKDINEVILKVKVVNSLLGMFYDEESVETVINNIEVNKDTYMTAVRGYDMLYIQGQPVEPRRDIGKNPYIRSTGNRQDKDNLDNLPIFK